MFESYDDSKRRIEFSGKKLVMCIALGMWLGWMAQVTTAGIGTWIATEWEKAKLSRELAKIQAEEKEAAERRAEKIRERNQQEYEQRKKEAALARWREKEQKRLDKLTSTACQFWQDNFRDNPTERAEQRMNEECGY